MEKIKLYLGSTLIIIGIMGLIAITFSYDLGDDYESISTDESSRISINTPDWRQGGVAIDSNVDGAIAGLGMSCGLMILSGSVLLAKIES